LLVVEAQLHAAAPIGIVLGLGSAAFYSGYILYGSRLLPGLPPVSATAMIMTSAAVVWGLFAAATGQLGVAWTAPRVALIGDFALLGTTIPVLTFILGLRLVGPSRAAILSTFEPASTGRLAVILLGAGEYGVPGRRDPGRLLQSAPLSRGCADHRVGAPAGGFGLAGVARFVP